MSNVEQFQFDKRQVRVIDRDGEPWWIAHDIAAILELGNIHSSLALLDDDERGIHTMETPGGPQSIAIINESGLYSLILRSRKPEAKAFKKWVTSEVLPSIRRTGGYQTVPVSVEMTINAFAEAYHDEHVVPIAGRILAFRRWRKPRKGIEAFVQLAMDINLPAIGGESRKGITAGGEAGNGS